MEMFEQFVQDFENLEDEHRVAAKNERIWSLGSTDPDDARMHGENAEIHEELAEFYKKIKENPTKFMILMEEF
jgi:hypothetical protein